MDIDAEAGRVAFELSLTVAIDNGIVDLDEFQKEIRQSLERVAQEARKDALEEMDEFCDNFFKIYETLSKSTADPHYQGLSAGLELVSNQIEKLKEQS